MKHNQELIEELAAIEAAEENGDADASLPPHVRVTRGHNRSRTLQVRLNDDELDRLNRVADEAGVPASTYARMLLLEGMDDQPRSVLPTLDPSSPEVLARIKHAMSHDTTFNIVLAAALAAEEIEEPRQTVSFNRKVKTSPGQKTTPAKKTAAAKKAAEAASRKVAAGKKMASEKTRKAPTGERFVRAAKRAGRK